MPIAPASPPISSATGAVGMKPRFLTSEEITAILEPLIPPPGAVSDIRRSYLFQIKSKIATQLSEKEVVSPPPPAAGEPIVLSEPHLRLQEMIVNQYIRSFVQPGDPVGILTGEANGQPITQLTLSSFHEAGSAKSISMGVEAYREVLNATRNRKHPTTTIHLKNKYLSFPEALELRRAFVGVTLDMLIQRREFESAITSEDTLVPMADRGWWYEMYLNLRNIPLPASRVYLRLYFDRNALYAYQIPLGEIVQKIQTNQGDTLICIPSPTHEAIIDIYVNEEAALRPVRDCVSKKRPPGITMENVGIIYLQNCLLPRMDDFLIRGIPGISQIFPVTITTWSIVRSETAIRETGSQSWIIWLETIRMRINGIPIEKMVSLLQKVGIRVDSTAEDHLIITMPEGWQTITSSSGEIAVTTPQEYVNAYVEAAKNQVEEERRLQISMGIPYPVIEVPELLRHSQHVYLEANGTNLKRILGHPLVDVRYTISNDFREVANVLGIAAARNYIARSIYEIIANNNMYINFRHITIIADVMTNMGIILPITSRGVAQQNRGTFADASFEQAIQVFIKSATMGHVEDINSVSSAIFMGKRARIGTGLVEVGLDHKRLAEIYTPEAKRVIPSLESLSGGGDIASEADLQFAGNQLNYEEGDDTRIVRIFDPDIAAPLGAPVEMAERTDEGSVGEKGPIPLPPLPMAAPEWIQALFAEVASIAPVLAEEEPVDAVHQLRPISLRFLQE